MGGLENNLVVMELLSVIVAIFSLACVCAIWGVVYELIKLMAMIDKIVTELRKIITVLAPNLNFEGEADKSEVIVKPSWQEHIEEPTD